MQQQHQSLYNFDLFIPCFSVFATPYLLGCFSNEIRLSFVDCVLLEFCRLWKLWHQATFYPWNHFQLDTFWHYLGIVLQNRCLISKKSEIKISIFSKSHASCQKNNHFLKPKVRLQRWFWILTWFQKNCSKS